MKAKEWREMGDEELQSELDRLHRSAFDLRSAAVTEKLEDPSLLTKARRDISRIMTIQRQREMAKQKAQEAPKAHEAQKAN